MNDDEAIGQCKEGHRDAFRHLVERYKDVLFGTAVLMTGNRAVSEEIVQEALLSAWRGIGGFKSGRPFKPWVVRILVNEVLARQRRKAVPTVPISDTELAAVSSEDGEPEDFESRALVRQAISDLVPEQKQVVVLRYFAELSVPEVARAIGVREGTVKSRLHRALARLRESLGEAGKEVVCHA